MTEPTTAAADGKRPWLQKKRYAILLALLTVTLFATACGDTSPVADNLEPELESEDRSTLASIMCENFVEDQLQAPATAGFPGVWDQQIDIVNAQRQRYRVHSHVDAENGFGAQIRTEYVCDIHNNSGDEWRLLNLQFAD